MALGAITLLAVAAVLALAAMLARQRRRDRSRSGVMLAKPSSTAKLGEPATFCYQPFCAVSPQRSCRMLNYGCGAMMAILKERE